MFKKWESDKENSLSMAEWNQQNTGFRMENGAGKARQGPDYERYEWPGCPEAPSTRDPFP